MVHLQFLQRLVIVQLFQLHVIIYMRTGANGQIVQSSVMVEYNIDFEELKKNIMNHIVKK